MPNKLHNKKSLKPIRKSVRNNGTSAEAVLWTQLSHSKLCDKKFRRQHSISNYVVDFYCPSEQLIIELDGQAHFTLEGQEKDKIRDGNLTALGFKVLRIENKHVFDNIEWVFEEIKKCFNNR